MMKFGILGFGNIARKFVKSIIYSDGVVYAIASKSVQDNDPYLQKNSSVKVYHDYEKLLKDPDVEAVYIALPHFQHKEWIIKALQHHKAVLSEKPIALSSKDIEEIMEAVKQYDGYCLEALKTKINVGYQSLKEDIKRLGKVQSIYANFCSDDQNIDKNSYLFDKKQGGALNDIGTYVFGFLLDLADSPIIKVESKIQRVNGIEMDFLTKLSFANGIIATGEGAINKEKERYALIKGEKGEIYIPMYNRITTYTIRLKDKIIERKYPFYGDDMTLEIQALIDDVKQHLHENKYHSLNDAKYIQEVIEMVRVHAK